MRRDYGPLLEIGEELARYQGYLSPNEEKECGKLEGTFAAERRKLVYELVKSGDAAPALVTMVNADLDRLEATGNHSEWAIDHVRGELSRHIEEQSGSSRLMQFATRWGPPALGAIAMAAYIYFRALR